MNHSYLSYASWAQGFYEMGIFKGTTLFLGRLTGLLMRKEIRNQSWRQSGQSKEKGSRKEKFSLNALSNGCSCKCSCIYPFIVMGEKNRRGLLGFS